MRKKIAIKLPLHPARSFLFKSQSIQFEEHASDVSTSNGRPVNWREVAVCLCLFGQYCHISAHARQKYRIGFDKFCRYYKTQAWHSTWKCECFRNRFDYVDHVIHPGRFEASLPIMDPKSRQGYRTTVTELRSFLKLGNFFCRFAPNFTHGAVPLNKKFRNGQLQTFDGLTNDGTNNWGTHKAKFKEPSCWPFHVRKVPVQ